MPGPPHDQSAVSIRALLLAFSLAATSVGAPGEPEVNEPGVANQRGDNGSPRDQILVTETIDDDPAVDNGACSLREAVIAANTNAVVDACDGTGADGPAHDIRFDPALTGATIVLDRTGADEDDADTGDLDVVNDDLAIIGPTDGDQASIIIDGNGTDRALDVHQSVRLDLRNATLRGGRVPSVGGGIRTFAESRVVLVDSAVTNNRAGPAASLTFLGIQGGGIFALGAVSLTRSLIADNEIVDDNSGARGAGIALGGIALSDPEWDTDLTIVDSRIDANRAQGTTDSSGVIGGGVYSIFSPVMIRGSEISNNTIEFTGASGLGAFGAGAALLPDSTTDNRISNSTFSGNSAAVANDAARGGGVYYDAGDSGATLTLNNLTITDNETGPTDDASLTTAAGGGLYLAAGEIVTANSLVAGNRSPVGGPDCGTAFDETITSAGYNLLGKDHPGCDFNALGSDQVGTGTDPINPRLEPLSDNGGPTRTHALNLASPAIDTGTPEVGFPGDQIPCEPTDQRGVTRPRDGDNDGESRCDIGAFEAPPPLDRLFADRFEAQ